MTTIENSIISLQIDKEITTLYKDFLEIVEDLRKDHETMLQKVAQKNGEQYSEDINYFNQSKYEQLRKRILDKGNNHLRQSLSFLDYFDFTINKGKVDAATQKKLSKKFVTSSPLILK